MSFMSGIHRERAISIALGTLLLFLAFMGCAIALSDAGDENIHVRTAAGDVNITKIGHFSGLTYAVEVSGNYAYIGDTLYSIPSGNNKDNYPLMRQNIWLLPQTDTWIPYTPASSQTIIDLTTTAGITYANVTLTFESSGYRIVDWGNVSRAGNEFSIDAKIQKFTGVVLTVMTSKSNGYLIGNLSSGNYSFIFKTWSNPVTTKEFSILAIGGDVISHYTGSDGIVSRSEAVQAVMDYFAGTIRREDAVAVVMAYLKT